MPSLDVAVRKLRAKDTGSRERRRLVHELLDGRGKAVINSSRRVVLQHAAHSLTAEPRGDGEQARERRQTSWELLTVAVAGRPAPHPTAQLYEKALPSVKLMQCAVDDAARFPEAVSEAVYHLLRRHSTHAGRERPLGVAFIETRLDTLGNLVESLVAAGVKSHRVLGVLAARMAEQVELGSTGKLSHKKMFSICLATLKSAQRIEANESKHTMLAAIADCLFGKERLLDYQIEGSFAQSLFKDVADRCRNSQDSELDAADAYFFVFEFVKRVNAMSDATGKMYRQKTLCIDFVLRLVEAASDPRVHCRMVHEALRAWALASDDVLPSASILVGAETVANALARVCEGIAASDSLGASELNCLTEIASSSFESVEPYSKEIFVRAARNPIQSVELMRKLCDGFVSRREVSDLLQILAESSSSSAALASELVSDGDFSKSLLEPLSAADPNMVYEGLLQIHRTPTPSIDGKLAVYVLGFQAVNGSNVFSIRTVSALRGCVDILQQRKSIKTDSLVPGECFRLGCALLVRCQAVDSLEDASLVETFEETGQQLATEIVKTEPLSRRGQLIALRCLVAVELLKLDSVDPSNMKSKARHALRKKRSLLRGVYKWGEWREDAARLEVLPQSSGEWEATDLSAISSEVNPQIDALFRDLCHATD